MVYAMVCYILMAQTLSVGLFFNIRWKITASALMGDKSSFLSANMQNYTDIA